MSLQVNQKLQATLRLWKTIRCTNTSLKSFKTNLECCKFKNTLSSPRMGHKGTPFLQIGNSKGLHSKIISKKKKTGLISSHFLNYTGLPKNSFLLRIAWQKTPGFNRQAPQLKIYTCSSSTYQNNNPQKRMCNCKRVSLFNRWPRGSLPSDCNSSKKSLMKNPTENNFYL
jgi:hypothetical protein